MSNMIATKSNRVHLLSLATLLGAAAAAQGQFVADGDLNSLSPGNAPSCGDPAGAWQFPPNYGAFCEPDPSNLRVVPTSLFQAAAAGNSLHVNIDNSVQLVQACNLFVSPIHPAAGQAVRVEFEIWVPANSPAGGTIYIGGDHGGGGYFHATDRGPQLTWREDSTIVAWAWDHALQAATPTLLVSSHPRGAWQQVRIDIRLDTQDFDAYWAPAGQPLQLVGSGLGFRSPTAINHIDRFSIGHFPNTAGFPLAIEHYLDNLAVSTPGACYANCDNSTTAPILNVADFACFLQRFAAADPYANCDQSTMPPILNVADFGCFLQQFAAGCR